MQLSNAYKGIIILIVAELMGFASDVLGRFPAQIFSLLANKAQHENIEKMSNYTAFLVIIFLMTAVLIIVVNIVMVVGALKLGKYEKKFKEALLMIIITAVVYLVAAAIDFDSLGYAGIIVSILDLWIMVAIIQGCINVSDKCEDFAMADIGVRVLKIVIIICGVTVVGDIAFEVLTENPTFFTISIVVASVEEISRSIAYILYIGYLVKVAKMLKRLKNA